MKPLRLALIGLLLPLATFLGPKPVIATQTTPKFTFAVVGDFGNITTGSNGYRVLQKIASSSPYPNFTIALGDFAYNYTNPANCCSTFKGIYPNAVLITGNHDTKNYGSTFTYLDHSTGKPSDTLTNDDGMGFLDTTGSSGTGYVQACGVPAGINWVGSGVAQGGAACLNATLSSPSCYGKEYYFDYPAFNPIMRFILISAGIGGTWVGSTGYAAHACPDSPLSHYCWLSAKIDEAKNAGLWVAVVNHKNCISDGSDFPNCESTFAPFNLTMTKKVDLWLDGHDHTYQRSFQLAEPCPYSNNVASCAIVNGGNGQQSNPYLRGNGTVVNIVGTGGVGNDPICSSCSQTVRNMFASLCGNGGPVSQGCNNDYGFSNFTITTNQISAKYVSATGSFTDSYVISVPNPPGDFSVPANPFSLTRRRGPGETPSSGIASLNINLNSFGHFSGPVTLSAVVSSGSPRQCSGGSCPTFSFSPSQVQVNDGSSVSSTLTISTTPTTPCGSSAANEVLTITVTGTSGSTSHTSKLFLTVYAKGDVTLDGIVDIVDLAAVGSTFGATLGQPGYYQADDLNSDGVINIVDIVIVAGNFGASC